LRYSIEVDERRKIERVWGGPYWAIYSRAVDDDDDGSFFIYITGLVQGMEKFQSLNRRQA
jgi:hypothetical protein